MNEYKRRWRVADLLLRIYHKIAGKLIQRDKRTTQMDNLIIRTAEEKDTHRCFQIESLCFEPSEAASLHKIQIRQQQYPDGFLIAEYNGSVIGMINSGATDKPDLADEEFKDMIGHDPGGKNLVIFSVAVIPEFQNKGISQKLMMAFLERAKDLDKRSVFLLCKSDLVTYYEKAGFNNCGESPSKHGGSSWWEMRLDL